MQRSHLITFAELEKSKSFLPQTSAPINSSSFNQMFILNLSTHLYILSVLLALQGSKSHRIYLIFISGFSFVSVPRDY